MKSNLGLLIKSLMLAGFLLCPVLVFAEDPANQENVVTERSSGLWPEEIKLDGQVFKKDQLNQAFLDTVFTKDVLNESEWGLNLDLLSRPGSLIHFDKAKNLYPWLLPHLYPQEGLPRLLVVNKWTGPVQVILGMPNDLKLAKNDKSASYRFSLNQEDLKEKINKVDITPYIEFITDLSKKLGSLASLNINYISNQDEVVGEFSGVHINFVALPDRDENKSIFKVGLSVTSITSYSTQPISFRDVAEKHIKTGFPFTSVSSKQVDGYILSNSKNEIQAAVCYIWIGHEPEMIKALVRECLIRSLGFPGVLRMGFAQRPVPASYLTLWNDPEKWSESYRSQVKHPADVSEFDQYMIRTLYNPAIKPGMDYLEAQKIMLGTEY